MSDDQDNSRSKGEGATSVRAPTKTAPSVTNETPEASLSSPVEVVADAVEPSKMRLRLLNIPPMFGVSQVRKFVADTLNIPQTCIVCRKAPNWTHALLTFRVAPLVEGNVPGSGSLPDLETIRGHLDGLQWKRAKLAARLEKAWEDPMLAAATAGKQVGRLNSTTTGGATSPKSLADQVTPLWKLSYDEQLEHKHKKLMSLLRQKLSLPTTWDMEPIKASPITEGYRNKCEFTIGMDTEGQPTVGFLLGGYREGIVAVANAQDTLHVPSVLKAIANHLQEHVRTSGMPVFDRTRKEGFWRLALARVHDGKVMMAVQVSGPAPTEALVALTEDMRKFVYEGEAHLLHSFFTQETEALHHGVDPKAPFILQFGEETIQQTLLGLSFRISPLSFFQVNIPATEILYRTIGDYVLDQGEPTTLEGPLKRPKSDTENSASIESPSKPVLLDLCCGTGTIGMTLASRVDRVIGVELVDEAIKDARVNAAANGITNIEFICERVETAVERVIASIPNTQPIVVVLDPPRAGVHPSVIKAIRRCARISRVVFVACNPEASAGNMVDLSRAESRALTGQPFTLKRAVVVDLFPHTEHCELVLQFDR